MLTSSLPDTFLWPENEVFFSCVMHARLLTSVTFFFLPFFFFIYIFLHDCRAINESEDNQARIGWFCVNEAPCLGGGKGAVGEIPSDFPGRVGLIFERGLTSSE